MLFKVIAWSLVAAVMALTIQPLHVHLQHIDDASSATHEHVIDLHTEIDNIVPAGREDGAVFPVTPEVMLKKLGDNPLLAAIIVSLSIILFSVTYISRRRPTIFLAQPRSGRFFIAPPLRAPPLL